MIYTKEIDFNGKNLKVAWNGKSQVNIQAMSNASGKWQDVDTITCYEIKDKYDALAEALDTLENSPEWSLS